MSAYKHGSADTTPQEETFDGFIKLVTRGSILCICILIFMAVFNS